MLRLAAEQGDAQSEHNLAGLYTQGLGVAQECERSSELDAQVRGTGTAAGQVGMGVLYENGDGVPEDPSKP